MHRFKIRDKLLSGFGSVVLILLATGLYSIHTLKNVTSEAEEMKKVYYTAAITSLSMKNEVSNVQQWLTDISATRGLDGLNDGYDEAEIAAVAFGEHLETLKGIYKGDKEAIAKLEKINVEFNDYYEVGKEMAAGYIKEGPALGNKLMGKFDNEAARIGKAMSEIKDKNVTAFTNSMATLENNASMSRKVSIALFAAGLLVSILSALMLSSLIIKPLNSVIKALKEIVNGNGVIGNKIDLSMRIKVSSKDEIGELGGGINVFLEKLEETIGGMTGNARSLTNASQKLSEVAEKIEKDVSDISVESMAVLSASEEMSGNISDIASTSEEATGNIHSVSAAVEELSQNMTHISENSNSVRDNGESVALAIGEMSTTLNEISSNTGKGARISSEAEKKSSEIKLLMESLGESTKTVGDVVEVINDIADRTNILALNATIEAASAGEAGKGFAVVANEVKELSKQTAKATGEVVRQIDEMQSNTDSVMLAIKDITSVIKEINEINISIAAAVEEQDVTTVEVAKTTSGTVQSMSDASRSVEEAATGAEEIAMNASELSRGVGDITKKITETADFSSDVTRRIMQINRSIDGTIDLSRSVKTSSDHLSSMAEVLYQVVGQFNIKESSVKDACVASIEETGDSTIEPMIKWDDSFSVNIKSMDVQHKRLVSLINKLNEAMKVGKSKDVMETLLGELIKYTASHFKDEEKLMGDYNYSGLGDQQREHTALVEQVVELEEQLKSGKASLSMDVMEFLKDWLSKHIMGNDKLYGLYLNSKGVS